MRDHVVLWVLGGGVVLAIVGWHLMGLWAALAAVLVAVAVAAVAYRVESPRIDLEHPEGWEARASRSADCIDR